MNKRLVDLLRHLVHDWNEYDLKLRAMEQVLRSHPLIRAEYEDRRDFLRNDPGLELNRASRLELLKELAGEPLLDQATDRRTRERG